MSRTPRRTTGPSKFSTNLYRLRVEKGMSQSDLAREIWGTTTDARGYTVAKHKDRISRWESGSQFPEPQNLLAVAKALGVSPEELAPDPQAGLRADPDENPVVNMKMLPNQPGRVHLIVNTLTSLEIASKVIALLSSDPSVGTPVPA